ncbi:MAG: DNA-formamidopyrimidine glycosylase [Bacillota bacterium]|jgi:formamidopyrimidine-DNA glycosylase
MPELPEVETLRRSLVPLVAGKIIKTVEVYNPVVIESGNPEDFIALQGAEITDIGRRGKYLLFTIIKDDEKLVMVAHMRMTGKLLFDNNVRENAKHEHVKFIFVGGSQLAFEDVRRFGRLWLVKQSDIFRVGGLNTLALEPLDDDFNVAYFEDKICRKKKSTVKGTLLDQHIVAGLGNIYVDEVLYAAGVHPERRVSSLTHEENCRLVKAMKDILQRAIENRGTTFRDYVDANNEKGGMQNLLKVFQHEGEPCPQCGAVIERIKVVGRSSYFCPCCQKSSGK